MTTSTKFLWAFVKEMSPQHDRSSTVPKGVCFIWSQVCCVDKKLKTIMEQKWFQLHLLIIITINYYRLWKI